MNGSTAISLCSAFNFTNSSLTSADRFTISNSCALFDFAIYTVLMGSLTALGVLGNGVSFAVLLRDRGRSATSFLLQALAVADTLVLLAAVPLYVAPSVFPYTGRLGGYYRAYMSLLPVLWPVYQMPYTFTVLVTVLVSMHRYCAVCKPTVRACGRIVAQSAGGGGGGGASGRFSPATARQARRRVAALVAFSVVYNIPRFFEYVSVEVCVGPNETASGFEVSTFGANRLYRILYANALYFVVIHGGPLLLIAFFNVKLIMALKRRQRRWAEMGKGWYQQDVSLVLVVVMCVFIVCQTPTFIDHILWTFVDERDRKCGRWHYYYTAIGDVLVIFNSSVNFVIYILTSRNFRHGLMLQAGGGAAGGAAGPGGGLRAPITGGTASNARSEYIALTRNGCGGNAVAVGGAIAPAAGCGLAQRGATGAAAAGAAVVDPLAVRRETPPTVISAVGNRTPSPRYFEPRIVLR